MIPKEKQAAQLLEGKVLADGWKVTRKVQRKEHNSGGIYSSCYEVENGDRKGFLKAFDYSGADKVGVDYATQIQNITSAFLYEREILEKCGQSRCKNVIELLSHGTMEIDEAEKDPRVTYLILEYAEKGDIRDVLKEEVASMEWKLRSIHQLAKGLNEIHKLEIAHQDIKPSNIVTTKTNVTKITDFGSAVPIKQAIDKLPVHLQRPYSGTWQYAPPELLYGEVSDDPVTRRIGCDLYLLGSMIVFYYTDMSMTALVKANLADELAWTNLETQGKYNELKPILIQAFEQALEDLARSIPDDEIRDKIVLSVRYLCNPDYKMRGHEKNIMQLGSNYSLERFVTMFDLMARYYFKKRK